MAAAAAAAALIEQARRNVVSHFLSRNAVSTDQAVGFEPQRRIERREFERLQRVEVLKPGRNGTFYLDPPAYDAWRQRHRRQGRMAVGGVLAVLAAGLGAILLLG